MTNKEANNDYIIAEEIKYLGKPIGEMFIEPEQEISGYDNMKVELMAPLSPDAYKDWVRSALYSALCTWDKTPQEPVTNEVLNKPFEEQEKLLFNILKDRPISVALEGVMFNFKITNVPRSLTHQIVRARQMAFGQQSYRVSSCYSDAVRAPQSLLDMPDGTKKDSMLRYFEEAVILNRKVYKMLIENGIPMEQARNIMPMGTCTKIGVVMRLRDLIDYVKARTGDISMDEHTYLIALILQELKAKQPEFFNVVKMFAKNVDSTMEKYLKQL